jgi:MFS family permease
MTTDPGSVRAASTHIPPTASLRLVYLAAVFAAVGGLLSGYDTGVISGALPFIKNSFTLSTFQQGLVVSVVLVGEAIAAIGGGSFSDRIGRRKALILTSVIFIAGALVSAMAPSMQVLIAGRVVIGFGIGLASSVVPLYISEIAPASARGWLVSCTNWR